MIFRRKKPEGFDWHAYVRTTIALRRAQRRAKIEEIGRVAAGQAKAAGGAAVDGVAKAAGTGWRASVSAWRATVAQPAIALPLTLCGLAAAISGGYKWMQTGPSSDAVVPALLGGLLLLAVAPLAIGRLPNSPISLPALGPALGAVKLPPSLITFGAFGALILALGWFAWGQGPLNLSSALSGPPTSSTSGPATVLEGRPTVLSGEMIRLNGRLLHLAGIEAPDRQQTCTRSSKQIWKCGEAAQQALEKLARKSFRCVTQGAPDASGRVAANCTVEGRDVASDLVKDGHVFSTATFFGGYAAIESEARRSGTGVWSGDAQRPADFRAKLWDAAKASAPNGCPVKGQVSGSRRTYLMPWSEDYARISVRTDKGERWFCNEAEAVAAGFKAKSLAVATR